MSRRILLPAAAALLPSEAPALVREGATTSKQKVDLMIFITPRLIESQEDDR